MAIIINNGETRPALTYDRLHILNFNLKIDRETYKKRIDMLAVPYAIDENGEKVFSDKQISLTTKDFDADSMAYAIANGVNISVEDAKIEYEAKVADVASKLATDSLNLWDLAASFEAALGKIFEIENAADFNTIE